MNQLQTVLDALNSAGSVRGYEEEQRYLNAIAIVRQMMQAEPVCTVDGNDINAISWNAGHENIGLGSPLYAAPQAGPAVSAQAEPVYGNVKSSAGLIRDGLVNHIVKLHFAAPQAVPAHLEEQPEGSVVDTRSEPQAVPEWLPIESAPKDKAVDLWCKSTSNPAYGRRVTSVCLVGDDWYGENLPNPSFGEYASHWMPLPASPKGVV